MNQPAEAFTTLQGAVDALEQNVAEIRAQLNDGKLPTEQELTLDQLNEISSATTRLQIAAAVAHNARRKL